MNSVYASLIYIFLSSFLLYIAKVMFNKFSFFNIEDRIKQKDFTSIIVFCGYILGITFVLIGAFVGPSAKLLRYDLLMYFAYGVLGIFLMNLSGVIADKVMLSKFSNAKEILEDKNMGTAAVHCAFYITTGLIVAACVNGEFGGFVSSVIYYILGMIFLFIFLKIYDLLTPYSIHAELEKDNYAVGIALAGNIIAIGLILAKATLGDVSDIHRNIILYFVDLASIVLLLPGIRYLLGNIIFRNINQELKNNNVAAGLIEFSGIICFAFIIFFMVDFSSVI